MRHIIAHQKKHSSQLQFRKKNWKKRTSFQNDVRFTESRVSRSGCFRRDELLAFQVMHLYKTQRWSYSLLFLFRVSDFQCWLLPTEWPGCNHYSLSFFYFMFSCYLPVPRYPLYYLFFRSVWTHHQQDLFTLQEGSCWGQWWLHDRLASDFGENMPVVCVNELSELECIEGRIEPPLSQPKL